MENVTQRRPYILRRLFFDKYEITTWRNVPDHQVMGASKLHVK